MQSAPPNLDQPRNWHRLLVASAAVILAMLGCFFHFAPSIETGGEFLAGVFWKLAMVFALAWVAQPQLERLGWHRVRGTLLIGLIVVGLLFAIRPRIGAIAAVVLVAMSLLATFGGWFRKLMR